MSFLKTEGYIDGALQDGQSVTSDWTSVGRTLIEGVHMIEIRSVPKRSGVLTEVFRPEWLSNHTVAHVFQVALAPGSVSAWHAHREATDRIFVSAGSITLALYDARDGSSTRGLVNEFFLTIARPQLVVIPPGVWHGLVVTGSAQAIVLNLVDRPYRYQDPDHWRLPADTGEIPYRFGAKRDSLG
jgi:dTDP-4-dehydrorhamnose 3,5-epimerase